MLKCNVMWGGMTWRSTIECRCSRFLPLMWARPFWKNHNVVHPL